AGRSEAIQRHQQRARQQHLLLLARQVLDRSAIGARVIGQHHVPFADLDVGLLQQAPVTGHSKRLVRDQRQRPGRQDQRRLLLVILQDHERGAQVVGHRLSGLELVLRDRGLGEDCLGTRADDGGVERLNEDHAHQERRQAEQGIAANRAHETSPREAKGGRRFRVPLVAIANPAQYVTHPLRVFELDFEANLDVVRHCVKYGKRLIFPSTSEIYGMSPDAVLDEEASPLVYGPINKQRWIYAASKQL